MGGNSAKVRDENARGIHPLRDGADDRRRPSTLSPVSSTPERRAAQRQAVLPELPSQRHAELELSPQHSLVKLVSSSSEAAPSRICFRCSWQTPENRISAFGVAGLKDWDVPADQFVARSNTQVSR